MICPKCGSETPLQKHFCINCGGFLELDRAEVREALVSEALGEAQTALTRRAGNWLAVSLVLLVLAWAFRSSHWEKDLPRFDEPAVLPGLLLEPDRPMAEIPMPELALPVPHP